MTTKTKTKPQKPKNLGIRAASHVRGGVKSGVRAGLVDGNFKVKP